MGIQLAIKESWVWFITCMSIQINRTFHPQVMPFSFEVKRLMEEKMSRPLATSERYDLFEWTYM